MKLLLYFFLSGTLLSRAFARIGDGCEKAFYDPRDMNCDPKNWTAADKRYCRGTRNGRGFWLSSAEPMAKEASPAMIRSVDTFQRILQNVSDAVIEKRRINDMLPRCAIRSNFIDDGATRQTDYVRQQSWKYAAINNQKTYGLQARESHCFTVITMNSSSSTSVWKRMQDYVRNLEVTAEKVLRKAKSSSGVDSVFKRSLACWSRIYVPNSRNVTTNNFRCTVMHVAGVRRPKTAASPSGKFNLLVPFTNAQVNFPMEDRARLYVAETWTASEGPDGRRLIRSVNTTSFRHGDIVRARPIPETTTQLFSWGGRILVSMFSGIPTVEGPAMQVIMERSAKNRDLLDDGTFPSNIALLILPAVLALIPSSYFEAWDRVSYLMIYILVADILAVLPLGIKGVEMLIRTRESFTACVAWNMGSELTDGLAIIELWCASCENHDRFKTIGTSLLVTAVALLIAGFVIEFITYKWAKRHRIRKRKKKLRMLQCMDCKCGAAGTGIDLEDDEVSLMRSSDDGSSWSNPWRSWSKPRFCR